MLAYIQENPHSQQADISRELVLLGVATDYQRYRSLGKSLAEAKIDAVFSTVRAKASMREAMTLEQEGYIASAIDAYLSGSQPQGPDSSGRRISRSVALRAAQLAAERGNTNKVFEAIAMAEGTSSRSVYDPLNVLAMELLDLCVDDPESAAKAIDLLHTFARDRLSPGMKKWEAELRARQWSAPPAQADRPD